jgi:hypothetical protein
VLQGAEKAGNELNTLPLETQGSIAAEGTYRVDKTHDSVRTVPVEAGSPDQEGVVINDSLVHGTDTLRNERSPKATQE